MYLVIVLMVLGRRASRWGAADPIEDWFTVESLASPSGLAFQLWNKTDQT